METLTLSRKAQVFGNEVYCEWHITNEGIENAVMHGMTLPIVGNVTGTLDAYQTNARDAILLGLEQLYPGMYE